MRIGDRVRFLYRELVTSQKLNLDTNKMENVSKVQYTEYSGIVEKLYRNHWFVIRDHGPMRFELIAVAEWMMVQ